MPTKSCQKIYGGWFFLKKIEDENADQAAPKRLPRNGLNRRKPVFSCLGRSHRMGDTGICVHRQWRDLTAGQVGRKPIFAAGDAFRLAL
jgi:hypothetical protein